MRKSKKGMKRGRETEKSKNNEWIKNRERDRETDRDEEREKNGFSPVTEKVQPGCVPTLSPR